MECRDSLSHGGVIVMTPDLNPGEDFKSMQISFDFTEQKVLINIWHYRAVNLTKFSFQKLKNK